MNKKSIFIWALYDFANSFIFINFLLYFSQWLVIDGRLSDFRYNLLFVLSTILLFLSAPILAAYIDRFGRRKFFLNVSTIGTAICYGLTVMIAYQGAMYMNWIALFFVLGQFFYQLSFVFYNAMIEGLSSVEHRGKVSGIGQVSNYLGQIVGILVMIPFSASRLDPLLPSVLIFIVLALPMMAFFKDTLPTKLFNTLALKHEVKNYFGRMRLFFKYSPAAILLVAFFFYNDALVTVTNNFSIFIDRVYGVTDSSKSTLLLLVLVTSGIGAFVAGRMADRYGLKRFIEWILLGWTVVLLFIAVAPTFKIYSILAVIVGLLLGSIWTVSRAYLSVILPKDQMNYGFSFYTLAERFSTFVGPLAWGITVTYIGNGTVFSYKIAVVVMAVFISIGYFILRSSKVNL